MRTAARAGIRLRVKAPVRGIVILPTAFVAHREHAHSGIRTIVRQAFDNSEPRSAVGAVGKWVEVAAIRRIKDFRQTIRTGGDIGQNEDASLAVAIALADLEIHKTRRIQQRIFATLDGGFRWTFFLDADKEVVELL